MIDGHKTVFLPIDERILCLHKGFVTDEGQMVPSEREGEAFDAISEPEYWPRSRFQIAFRIVITILVLPFLILLAVVEALFKKDYSSSKFLNKVEDYFFRPESRIKEYRSWNVIHPGFHEEDIPSFITHCHDHFARLVLYSYLPISKTNSYLLDELIATNQIDDFQVIRVLSDLKGYLKSADVSVHNSMLVIKDYEERLEAIQLGFNPNNGDARNVYLWKSRILGPDGRDEMEWNSNVTLFEMQRNVNRYIKAKSNPCFTNDIIIYIEDEWDEDINSYIQTNFTSIQSSLRDKGMTLLYYPKLQSDTTPINQLLRQYLFYRRPDLRSLKETDLDNFIILALDLIKPASFYKSLLSLLELPYFPRPSLLRFIGLEHEKDSAEFTYTHLRRDSFVNIQAAFEWYLERVSIPTDEAVYMRVPPPEQYDADYWFSSESKEISDELKAKIDFIKSEGQIGVLAEAVTYLLAKIKETQPELIDKLKPAIRNQKLLEPKVVLSPIVVDEHYKLFLPGFGNVEIRLHALPKTLYLFYLNHPEGIRLPELYEHKRELLSIYNKLTNKYSNEEIEKAIDDLVDMTNPSVNQKCSRIRAAFREIMDEDIAKHYYIDGPMGEAKKISLPADLIDIRF